MPYCKKCRVNRESLFCPDCGAKTVDIEIKKNRELSNAKVICFLVFMLFGLCFLAKMCIFWEQQPAKGLRTERAMFIDTIHAEVKGDYGIQIYFSLADKDGYLVTDNGTFKLYVYEENLGFSKRKLFESRTEVLGQDFRKTTVGIGSFEHETLLYDIGIIKFSDFNEAPSSDSIGSVAAEFIRTDGVVLKGAEDTVFFK